jgi:hypothetical protein
LQVVLQLLAPAEQLKGLAFAGVVGLLVQLDEPEPALKAQYMTTSHSSVWQLREVRHGS